MPEVPDMVVFARQPSEMEAAQQRMITWALGAEAQERVDLAELEENLRIAKKNKWRTSGLVSAVRKAKKSVTFYEKTRSALQAGYCIVPNFPVGVFAVKTKKTTPEGQHNLYDWPEQIPDAKHDHSKVGEGRYVEPQVAAVSRTRTGGDGIKRTHHSPAWQYTEVGFPFTYVKPQIMESASRAMALKIFDEVGCLPEPTKRDRDPMVVGRVVRREGSDERVFTFLIAWWMDLRRM